MWNTMAEVVDLPEVPPDGDGPFLLEMEESNSERFTTVMPI